MDSPTEGRQAAVPVPVVALDAPPPPPPPPRRESGWALVIGAVVLVMVVGLAIVAGVAFTLFGPEPDAAASSPPAIALPPSDDAGSATEPAELPVEVPVEVPVELPVVEPVAAPSQTPDPAAPSCPDHSGHWAGTWGASTSRGTWTADFTERPAAEGEGTELHGDIRVRGTSCGTGGHIVGRILEDCSVEFDPYRTGPCRVRYQANFEGDRLSGTLAATGFGMADSGRWRGTRRGPVAPSDSP